MNIGDIVVRKKYNKDILFEIVDIDGDMCLLRGIEFRLVADSGISDLEKCDAYMSELPVLSLDHSSVLKGKVLHLDGDRSYLKMCKKKYDELGIHSICEYVEEGDMKDRVVSLLEVYKPHILVLTGHDALKKDKDKNDIHSYMHSLDYSEAIKNARTYEYDKDMLVIVAGACQSYYEFLLASGANFASSPKRRNIHALDPVLIASLIAGSSVKNYCDIEDIVSCTFHKSEGMGGIDTRGTARNIYP